LSRLLPVLLAALGFSGCHHSSSAPPGVSLQTGPAQPLVVEPGARSVVLLAFGLQGIGAGGTVETLQLQVRTAGGIPPVRGLRLVEDRDRNQSFDQDSDTLLAELDLTGGTASVRLGRHFDPGAAASFLILGNVRPAAMGSRFDVALHAAAANAPITGPPVTVVDRLFAAGGVLSGGCVDAALHLSPDPRPVRILVGGNPVSNLQREAPGIYSFLLAGVPAGPASILLLDGASRQLATLPAAIPVNHGRGPARFLDVSLSHLPADHAFSQDAAVCDVDGDGDPDLLIPSYASQVDRLYLNDGRGRFTDVTASHMPPLRLDTVHLEPFDADGDGDVDVAVAVEGGRNRLYLNDGTGHFRDVTLEDGRMPATPDFSEDLRAGDLDGDGDLDLVVANLVDHEDSRRGGQIRVYLNNGRGFFADATAARIPLAPTRTYDVDLGDLDGDGDLDLFAAGYGETDRIYENVGGYFALAGPLPPHQAFHTSAVLGDLDGDGDLDIVAGTFQGQSHLYVNQGKLRFADASSQLSLGEMSTYDVDLADLDGDGDLDLVFANTHNPSVVATNDGHGRFAALPRADFFTPDDPAYDVQVLDADGDGALDILVTCWGNRQDTLYLARELPLPPDQAPRLTRVEPNWGTPAGGTWVTFRGQGFMAGTTAAVGGVPVTELTVADDRTLQGVVPSGSAGPAPVTIRVPGFPPQTHATGFHYEEPPAGALRDATRELLGAEPASTTAVAAGDLTGNGLPDLVFADLEVGARVRINAGTGIMGKGSFPQVTASANDVKLADLDGDGRLDVVLAVAGGPPLVFQGQDKGFFAKGLGLPAPAGGSEEVVVGDLDGDRDPDLVFAVSGREVILRNDGKLRFTALDNSKLIDDTSKGVALGDVDGDGDLDLLVANFMQRVRLYLNSGSATFTEAANALPDNQGDQSYGIALADVDGDGDLDAAIANGGAQVNRLFLNDGRGQFQEAPVGVFRPALGGGAHVVFGDVDGDGRPDLFSAHFWGNNHLYFADAGRLAERAGMLPNSPGGFAGAVFTDIDGDGDLDLVLAAFWGGCRILENPRRTSASIPK